jgi:hypothetical protein
VPLGQGNQETTLAGAKHGPLLEKRALGRRGGTGQGSEAPRLQPLPPTSDGGLAPAVGLQALLQRLLSSNLFWTNLVSKKMHYANSESAEAARPRAYQRVVTFLNLLPCRHSTSAVARLLCDLLRASAAQTLSDEA